MIDIEAALIPYFRGKGYLALTEIPPDRPERFISIERTGGDRSDYVLDHPNVVIQCWAKTRAEASALAYEVDDLVEGLSEVPHIFSAKRNSLSHFPDVEGKHERYQLYIELTTR